MPPIPVIQMLHAKIFFSLVFNKIFFKDFEKYSQFLLAETMLKDFVCSCNDGFEGDGLSCLPIQQVDECITGEHNCDANATCSDLGVHMPVSHIIFQASVILIPNKT